MSGERSKTRAPFGNRNRAEFFMNSFARGALAALCLMTGTSIALSQDAAPKQTYTSLMNQGFEIKNILLLPNGTSSRMQGTVSSETVLVTLQKGPVTATCWITLSAWQSHNIGGDNCNLLQ
jgi:hypothetical protein